MNLLFYKVDKEDFDYFLQSSNLIMCKRNFYSAYNDFFVLLSAEGHLEAACVIKPIDDDNLYIKLFEVSEMNFGQGIGRLLFNKIVKFYSNNTNQLTFELENSVDEDSDNYFVKDIFSQGMVICWMQQQIDKAISLAAVIGGKEEKTILNNYKNNMARLKELKLQLRNQCHFVME